MNRNAGRFEGRDWLIAALFCAVGLVTRIPFRSHFAYQWDSAQFALAVGEYNIRISQPHAPGFYLYVMLGRLMNLLIGEPHTALVWLSVIAGAWLTGVGYLLSTSMFGRRCGLGTGLILLTSPLCWFHSEVALMNIVDSALIVTFVLVCWRAIHRGVTWLQTVTLAVLFASIAGVRQQTAPLLIPLLVYVFWGFARLPTRKFLCATLLIVGLSLCWFVPTIKSAGSLPLYLELLRLKSRFDAPRTIWGGGGLEALLTHISWMGRACWVGLLSAGIIALGEFVYWVILQEPTAKSASYRTNKTQLWVVALWILPMLLFGAVVMYVALPGHMLNFFPAVAVLASLGVGRFAEHLGSWSSVSRAWVYSAVLAAVVITNAIVFVWSPHSIMPLLGGLTMTSVEISQHDADLSACFQKIRKTWPSKDVIVCHQGDNFYWGFRQFQYHLPEYENILLTTDASLPGALGAEKWIGYERETTFRSEVSIPKGEDVVLFVTPDQSIRSFKSYFDLRNASLLLDSGAKLYSIEAAKAGLGRQDHASVPMSEK